MSKKQTIKDFEMLAESRQHTLISVSKPDLPSGGDLTILCNTCNKTFETSAHSYKNARQTGCPICKAAKASEQWANKPRSLTPEQSKKKIAKSEAIEKAKEEKRKLYAGMKSREDLIKYLEGEANEYSKFILDRMKNPPPANAERIEQHHAIPLHAGGPDETWNLIPLIPQDHFKAHELRAQVYNEQGDKNMIKLRPADGSSLSESTIKRIKTGDATRKEKGTGIYAEGASEKGGRAGGAVKSESKDLSHQSKMSELVKKALYEGSSWVHKTGVTCNVTPEEANTMPKLAKLLAKALPLDCKDRKSLENVEKPVNVTSGLAKVIRNERSSAYGWRLNN